MQALVQVIRHALVICGFIFSVAFGGSSFAAPYAAMVMDARTGEVLYATNHDTKLHPASLTKMMTLYVAFEAIKHGELTLDTMVTVSRRATATECVCLGLRPGQRISMRNLIRAAALRSANDASVVIAEAVSGSVEEFARRMTRTGRAIGMSNTTFQNPHGLTQAGHISTARDMTILGRQLFFDYPEYYNIFSRRSENAGAATVANTNRRFLDSYAGADGIKTGFTRAAGFNLTASARRGNKHIITTVFGGTSTAARNAKVAELMDLGFSRAKDRVASRAPATPAYRGQGAVAVARAEPEVMSPNAVNRPAVAKTIRLQTAVRTSPRPLPRPDRTDPAALLAVVRDSVDAAVAQLAAAPPAPPAAAPAPAVVPAVVPPPRPERPAEAPAADLAAAQAAGFSIAAPDDLAALTVVAAPPVIEQPTDATMTADVELPFAVVENSPEPEPEIVVAAAPSPAPQPAPSPAPEQVAQAPAPEILWSGASDSMTLTAAPALIPIPEADLETAMAAHVDLDYVPASLEPVTASGASGIILTRAPSPDVAAAPAHETPQLHAATTVPVPDLQVINRLSTSDSGRIWVVSLGEFSSRSAAERSLITVKMAEASALGNGISRIRQTSGRYEALFAGLSAQEADRACLRLLARGMECAVSNN
jgi:D-alanyl-D-alanine carboxypeptidase